MTGFYRPGQRNEQRMRRFMSIGGAGVIAPVAGADPFFANVVSLLHFEGANNSTAFPDITGKVWTRTGSITKISTVAQKYGLSSMLVGTTWGPGTGNGITTPSHADFNFGTADFTLEWWSFYNDLPDFQVAFDRGGVTAGGLRVQTGSGDGKINVYVGGSLVMAETTAATLLAWEHHALCKDAGTLRKYRGGVQTASAANSTNITNTAPAAWGAAASGANAMAAYMDDARITKGVCRYPSGTTFTPPAAFPDS